MSYSFGVDAPVNSLFNAPQIEAAFSFDADLCEMLRFEKALASAQAARGLIPKAHATQINEILSTFEINKDDVLGRFSKDGVTPPAIIQQIKKQLNDALKPSFHTGATSQDLIDTSLIIRVKRCVEIVSRLLSDLDVKLATHAQANDTRVLQARTRMQNALPISPTEKVNHWRMQIERLQASKPSRFPLQLGGPEGAALKFGDHYQDIAQAMANELGLYAPNSHWHTDRQPIMSIAFWFSQAATVMGKIATDVLMMVQSDVQEVRLEGGGASSAMAHKQNPIAAEMIVAQARYCHAQMSGLNTASIHENERSGVAWTLEWLLLPPLFVAASSAIENTIKMIEAMMFIT